MNLVSVHGALWRPRAVAAGSAIALALPVSLFAFGTACAGAGGGDDPYADVVVEFEPGAGGVPGYNDPQTAIGPPTRFTGGVFDPMIVSAMNAAWRPDEIVSIGEGGSITLQFNTPVTDDPDNPFGIDLLIFGNSFFIDASPHDSAVDQPAVLYSEGGVIEVSPDGEQWCTIENVTADGMFPTEGYLDHTDPYATEPGSFDADFTRPVDPQLSLSDFSGLSYIEVLDSYRGSGGGAGIDLTAAGMDSITHVRISNPVGSGVSPEIDAVADVSPRYPGDVNGDGVVDTADLLELLSLWGDARPGGWDADFNGDGSVDTADLLVLVGHWST